MNGINKILKGDKVIWILALLLGIISLVVVYSAASALVVRNYDGNTGRMLMKHAGTLFLGYLMMFIAYKINYQHYSTIFKFVLWLCIPLLLMLGWKGTSTDHRIPGFLCSSNDYW